MVITSSQPTVLKEIPSEFQWLFFYTLPCTRGNPQAFERLLEIGKFNEFLDGDYSRQNVRAYFLGQHNKRTYPNFFHMLRPYDIMIASHTTYGFKNKSLDLFLPDDWDEITIPYQMITNAEEIGTIPPEYTVRNDSQVYIHANWIVDVK